MENNGRYIFVGAGVLILLAALLGTLFWLMRDGERAYKSYAIYFAKQSLLGIQVGSSVNVRGIPVGTVKEYSFSNSRPGQIAVVIGIDNKIPVLHGTRALVSRNFLTGLARIDLELSPDAQAKELTASLDYPHPIIEEGPTPQLAELDKLVGDVRRDIAKVADSISHVLSDENQAIFVRTIASVGHLSESLSDRLNQIDMIALKAKEASSAIQRASDQVTHSAVSLDQLLVKLSPVAQQAESTLQTFTHTAQALESASVSLKQDVGLAIEMSIRDLHAITRGFNSTLFIGARSIDSFREPASVLWGPSSYQLGPGEESSP